jgi:hypothetical protein
MAGRQWRKVSTMFSVKGVGTDVVWGTELEHYGLG